MRLRYVIPQSFLLFTAVQLSFGFVSKERIQSKQNDLVQDELRRRRVLDDDEVLNKRSGVDSQTRLLNHIKMAAQPFRLPTLHLHTPIEVHVRAALYQIFDLDQMNSIATISGYFDIWWTDPWLRWNAAEFSNISKTFIPAKWFWKPEFYLYHGIQGKIPDYGPDAVAEINADGRLRMFIPLMARALCPLNVKYFPFDTQNCTFACGSWSYQHEYVNMVVDQREIFLGDFYNNQEWLLENATLHNGTVEYTQHEAFSTVHMSLILRRQSFYYVFNFVFPNTLTASNLRILTLFWVRELEIIAIPNPFLGDHDGKVSLVAVIGFHAPINATGRRETKFRLGIMTLLSMSVMLLILVDEMKFALESFPGQSGSFSGVPLLGVFYMIQMLIVSMATCTSSIFVHLEKYALRNQYIQAIPWWLRFLTAERLFCCYIPKKFRMVSTENTKRNHNVTTRFVSPSSESFTFRDIIPAEVNMTECHQETAISEAFAEVLPPVNSQRIELLVSLMREFIQMKEEAQRRFCLPAYWERVIKRLENIALTIYLILITTNVFMLLCPQLWY